MSLIRTRFAPSPTGYIHIGNIRAALFPWLLAKQANGTFILRIEDTDQTRFVEGATDLIIDTLNWLGLYWNEGYLIGGDNGPYVQSERKEIYIEWAKKLIDKGMAYADPYTPQEVDAFREEAKLAKRPFLYRDYRPVNPPKWDGTQALRFKVPYIKKYTWHDPIMGDLSAGPEVLDDFILIKSANSGGLPTYNFAHIVDDTLMKVTHVLRGLEYISSIPKYLSLYEALEINPPILACMPHIMAPDGKKKLGKRDGAKSVNEYRNDGVLPEAMINFLASLGWNDGTEQEIFSVDELISKFSLDRVQKSGAKFDEERLKWMNGQWIRRISLEDLYKRSGAFWPESANSYSIEYKQSILAIIQERLKFLSEIPAMTYFFFEEPKTQLELIDNNKQLSKFSYSELAELLVITIEKFKSTDFKASIIQDSLNQLLAETGQKPGVLFSLVRIVTTWVPFSPSLPESLEIIGQQKTIYRLEVARDLFLNK